MIIFVVDFHHVTTKKKSLVNGLKDFELQDRLKNSP
jgi:hypothetical protein